jgi:hypothetical protein
MPTITPMGATGTRRRLPILAAVVVLAVVAGLFLVLVRRSSDNRSTTVSWDSVAVVDRRTGSVALLDADGDEAGSLDGEIGALDHVIGEGPALALIGRGTAAVVDVPNGAVTAPDVAADARAARIPTSRPMALAAASPVRPDAVIVLDGTTLHVDAETVLEGIRSDPDGTLFAVPDLRALQSVAVGPEPDGPRPLPGLPVGVTDETAVTIESAERAQLHFFTFDGVELGTTGTSRPAAAAVARSGDVILVSASGDVQRVDPGEEDAEEVGTLPVDGDVFAAATLLGGRRLVVSADRSIAVLDDHGDQRSTLTLDGALLRQPLVHHPDQRCVLALTDAGEATMIDTESGDVLGVLDKVVTVNGTSIDGCTAAVTRPDDFALLREGTQLRLDRDQSVVAIAPGGDHAVVLDRDGHAWLRDLDDSSPDVDLGTHPDALYAFVERLSG